MYIINAHYSEHQEAVQNATTTGSIYALHIDYVPFIHRLFHNKFRQKAMHSAFIFHNMKCTNINWYQSCTASNTPMSIPHLSLFVRIQQNCRIASNQKQFKYFPKDLWTNKKQFIHEMHDFLCAPSMEIHGKLSTPKKPNVALDRRRKGMESGVIVMHHLSSHSIQSTQSGCWHPQFPKIDKR